MYCRDSVPLVHALGAADPASSQQELLVRVETLLRLMRPTPIVELHVPGIELRAKLEYSNVVGSLKDRAAIWALRAAIARGEIGPGTQVIESSSGNFARALAFYCRFLGLDFVPVIDPNIAMLNELSLRASCHRVERVTERDDTGGYLRTRIERVRQLCASDPNLFWTNQYENQDCALGHYYLTAREICEQNGHLDYAFIGVSSGGTICGVSQRLKETYPGICIVAVDSVGSTIFGGPVKRRHIPGIGSSIRPGLLGGARIDHVELVEERDAVRGCLELLNTHRLFVGGSSGSAYWGVKQFFARNPPPSRPPRVLFLCADPGVAYQHTVFDPRWVKRLEESA